MKEEEGIMIAVILGGGASLGIWQSDRVNKGQGLVKSVEMWSASLSQEIIPVGKKKKSVDPLKSLS